MKPLRIGTRGSRLARWQSAHVAEAIAGLPDAPPTVEQVIRTEGDESAIEGVPIESGGEVGVFVRRIERALLEGEIDLAVHSLKDLPTVQPDGLRIAAVTKRLDPRDALVSREGWTVDELPRGARVGTSSPRRRCQLLHRRPDIEVVPVRGNVDTRVGKVQEGGLDAVVLALAGLQRLELAELPVRPIEPQQCLPAVGQAALAIECRADDTPVVELLSQLDHPHSRACTTAERAFLRQLGAGCQAPAAAWAVSYGSDLQVTGLVGQLDGRGILCDREAGPPELSESVGMRLAERLLSAGARVILERSRDG
jgi:hydroxymethylbilane synthase